jgi:hypothetical protein
MIGFSARSDGGQFALHPAFITNRTVSLHLMHFTLPGAGDGTSGDSAAQSGNAPDDPMIQIDQMIEQALKDCQANGCDPATLKDKLTQYYIQIADTRSTVRLRPMTTAGDGLDDQLKLMFTGSAAWNITTMQQIDSACQFTSDPSSGKAEVLVAKVQLYKQRKVLVPGQGLVITNVFDPDLALYLRANLATMPKEGRIAYCSPAPSHPIADIFGEIFLGLHNDEVVIPQPGSVEASTLGGPAIKMTGFEQGGGDIIFTKEYSRSVPTGGFPVTEVTTIKLRHTPKK